MSETFKIITPIDGSVYAEREYANQEDINAALNQAKLAQSKWKRLSITERAKYCSAFVNAFENNVDQISEELTWQMGRPIVDSPGEIKGVAERANYMIEIAEDVLSSIPIDSKQQVTRFIEREPLGVVLVIAPWNYPYLTAINSIIPALLAGNTVILKHSSQTPLCAERLAQAFEQADFPKGVFQFLHLTHEHCEKLIHSDCIDFVAFTGSVLAGKRLQQVVSDRFIGLGLELGGKDPAYVRADANLENSVNELVDGAFFNAGQSCCGIERIYVHEDIYQSFILAFMSKVQEYCVGNPFNKETTLGPLINDKAAALVRMQIKDAISQGAIPLLDANHFNTHDLPTQYVTPQVLIDVTHNMQVMRHESFGPVVGIMKVRTDESALQFMNDSQFGLTASLWTQDESKALEIGRQINTGTVFMNRCDYLDPAYDFVRHYVCYAY